MKIIQILALIVLILLTTPAAIAQSHGGSTTITEASVLHGVCGEDTKGWLLVVGMGYTGQNRYGAVYSVSNLAGSPALLLSINPADVRGGLGNQYNTLILYACSVIQTTTDKYLLWLVGTIRGWGGGVGVSPRGIVLVYDITPGSAPNRLGYTVYTTESSFVDFVVVRNTTDPKVYHVYVLSLRDTNVDLLNINVTVTTTASFTPFTTIFTATGSGYGISYNPWLNTLGVLRTSGGNLVLSVYGNVDTGSPTPLRNETVVPRFTGTRAAEAAYSGGYIVAAGGKLYKLDGSDLSVSVLIDNAFSGEAYAMLISERDGRSAAYLYAVYNNAISIYAYDLLRPGTAYFDTIISGLSMSGYGDAFIVYADGNKAVKPAGTGSPYMVYTAGNAIIYYDLTRGGTAPYPIPEPNILLAVAVIAIASIVLFKIASKIIY